MLALSLSSFLHSNSTQRVSEVLGITLSLGLAKIKRTPAVSMKSPQCVEETVKKRFQNNVARAVINVMNKFF